MLIENYFKDLRETDVVIWNNDAFAKFHKEQKPTCKWAVCEQCLKNANWDKVERIFLLLELDWENGFIQSLSGVEVLNKIRFEKACVAPVFTFSFFSAKQLRQIISNATVSELKYIERNHHNIITEVCYSNLEFFDVDRNSLIKTLEKFEIHGTHRISTYVLCNNVYEILEDDKSQNELNIALSKLISRVKLRCLLYNDINYKTILNSINNVISCKNFIIEKYFKIIIKLSKLIENEFTNIYRSNAL